VAGNAPSSTRKDETIAYEVDKKIEHTRGQIGGLRRMTAAVVVNHRRTLEGGKATSAPLAEKEMEQINALVREAMGYSKERGDSLNVVNTAFNEPEREPPAAELPLWKQPDNIAMAKDAGRYLLFAGLVGYLVFGLLRPTLKRAAERIPALPEPAAAVAGQHIPASGASASAGDDPLARARRIAREDPKVVANVVKSWVARDE
jgi:flagellar M-ring protein FliF